MSIERSVKFTSKCGTTVGYAIHGTFPQDTAIIDSALDDMSGKLNLVMTDPPYGNIVDDDWDQVGKDDIRFCDWMLNWTNICSSYLDEGEAMYVWGGIGLPNFRPFYRYLVEVENQTGLKLANHITWKKKRAYGVQHNYIFTREELAYLLKGSDIKKPKKFNIPLLATKRGYAGYNAKYPAKSEFYRRTSVWDDVTEIFQGKIHTAQKPTQLYEIPILVHTDEKDIVFDPFAGSGTCALAAYANRRRFVVMERDKTIFDIMIKNILDTTGCITQDWQEPSVEEDVNSI